MENDYYALPESEAVLLAEANVVYALTGMRRMDLLTNLYEKVYATPEIYTECQKTLGIDELKEFGNTVQEKEFAASKAGTASVMELSEILTESDAYAMLCGMEEKIDVLLDDPRKAKIFSSHSVHALRLSDILSAAANTKKREAA